VFKYPFCRFSYIGGDVSPFGVWLAVNLFHCIKNSFFISLFYHKTSF
jgi:hypothetical protein